ncbi:hypothetical protein EB241_05805 [Erwinia psidii]|uniref:Uncharacterized protein n=2 Tax=Erwinia psidii TaxID=69224 RepID=A0A3N6S347_9GAMM|nr:hypothetical protein EB241_05805 [Erwinia psidii]
MGDLIPGVPEKYTDIEPSIRWHNFSEYGENGVRGTMSNVVNTENTFYRKIKEPLLVNGSLAIRYCLSLNQAAILTSHYAGLLLLFGKLYRQALICLFA